VSACEIISGASPGYRLVDRLSRLSDPMHSLPEYVALADRAAHRLNVNRSYFDQAVAPSLLHDILASLSCIDNSGLVARASTLQIDGNPTRTALKFTVDDNRVPLEIGAIFRI
jgi:hypothetical protein